MIPIKSDSLPLPPPETAVAPPPIVSVEAPAPAAPKKASTFDRITDAVGNIGNAMHQGLSYANARRARSTYRG